MPEPLTTAYLVHAQKVIIGLPRGPWEVEASEHGLPDRVGPISFLETWSEAERIPVVEFISYARDALPALVGEVTRQRDQLRRLEAENRRLRESDGSAHRV